MSTLEKAVFSANAEIPAPELSLAELQRQFRNSLVFELAAVGVYSDVAHLIADYALPSVEWQRRLHPFVTYGEDGRTCTANSFSWPSIVVMANVRVADRYLWEFDILDKHHEMYVGVTSDPAITASERSMHSRRNSILYYGGCFELPPRHLNPFSNGPFGSLSVIYSRARQSVGGGGIRGFE